MRVDLHLHTTVSDGLFAPAEVVARALAGGLSLISITDHDTADGVAEAVVAARDSDLTVLSGTELSSSSEGRELHILGYGVDADAPEIRAHHEAATSGRRERMASMLDRLARFHDIHIAMEQVQAAAYQENCMIGRPHLARALVDEGHAADMNQAFDTLIGDGHRAFVPTALGTPADAIATIRAAGGIPVWAHPPGDLLSELAGPLADAGLRGLEAYRPTWSPRRARRVEKVAAEHDLVLTGGSDWHGRTVHGELGEFWVRWRQIRPFLELLASTGHDIPKAVDDSEELV